MAMFVCNGDTSGIQPDQEGAVVFCGLLTNEKRWLRFEEGWNKHLRTYGLEQLHMKDYGPVALAWGETKARGFESGAVGIIRGSIHVGVLSAVQPAHFRKADAEFKLTEGLENGPYGLAAWLGIQRVLRWMEQNQPKDQVKYVIERGDPGQGAMRKYTDDQDLPVEFPPKSSRIRPLEAADLVAWASKREYDERAEGKRPAPRDLSTIVHKRLPLLYGRHDYRSLVRMCKARPDQFPPRV